MKIIKNGTNKKHTYKGICNKCGCEFIVSRDELIEISFGDCRSDYKSYGNCFCPEKFCDNKVICSEI